MKFRIHYTLGEDFEDYFDVEGETIEEIREIVEKEMRPGATNKWSEKLED